jgi:ABC-type uncharacterized transport system auxiliary subunit
VVVVALVVAAGCLFPTPPTSPRYFAPEASRPEPTAPAAPVAVRLGIVRGPLYLREQMTWRRSDVEYGFYDQRRWTELPATYVERALARALVGIRQVPGPGADVPVLSAEVRAFEEVLAPVHEARVAVAVELAVGRCVRLQRSFAAARSLSDDDPMAVARGIGEALDEVARAVRDAVGGALAAGVGCGT